ncbi:DUF3455 domain-containing protein [Granulicella sp. L60]|uniref:DUF3455 domain-containing protein n=1 Tax=Granulicella sp. L60 TaxID=1641866 RepID=UPI00131B5986|nr:DUF3455 domain-containing protein [Granulicella sp. L60]
MTLPIRLCLTIAATILPFVTTHAQTPTDPPPSQHAILTATGKGVQIYTCQQTTGSPQWVFQAPEANLINARGKSIGSHGAGPIWRSKDGSTVTGKLLQKSSSDEPGAIPWLLLQAASTEGTGVMSRVEYIRRSATHGGDVPTAPCDAQHLNITTRVPYSATYTFYSAKP